jgi:hypothetical protein
LSGSKVPVPGSVWISLDDGWKENRVNVVPFAAENKNGNFYFYGTG